MKTFDDLSGFRTRRRTHIKDLNTQSCTSFKSDRGSLPYDEVGYPTPTVESLIQLLQMRQNVSLRFGYLCRLHTLPTDISLKRRQWVTTVNRKEFASLHVRFVRRGIPSVAAVRENCVIDFG
jgi:hypothetical protein